MNQHPADSPGAGADLNTTAREELRALRDRDLLRTLKTLDGAQAAEVELDGRRVINFSSNNYLGLAADPMVAEWVREGLDRFGTGSGASRLISGTQTPHARLEKTLAEFKGCEAALSFSSGYATALGVIPAMVGKNDVIIVDKLCHACLIDGARLSGARIRVFPHNNTEKLRGHLDWARTRRPGARVLVLLESVYSMDGDRAPLAEMEAVCREFGAILLVDEAHALGVVGRHGQGLITELGLNRRIALQMGTFSKAAGIAGGYVCGSREVIDLLINKARSFIFSTAPPPAFVFALQKVFEWLGTSDGAARVARMWQNSRILAEILGLEDPQSPILPFGRMSEKAVLALAANLLERGIYAPAVRYPTVPRNEARLRFSVSAIHEKPHLQAVRAWQNDREAS